MSVRHFHCYLYGRPFTLRTDHGSLRWLKNFKNPEGQLARWLEILSEYDFVIEHRRGRSHMNADALSRRPCPEECKHCRKIEEKENQNVDISVQNQADQLDKTICAVNNETDNIDELVSHNEEMCDEERYVWNLLNDGNLSVDILRQE